MDFYGVNFYKTKISGIVEMKLYKLRKRNLTIYDQNFTTVFTVVSK